MTGSLMALAVLIFICCFAVERSFPGWALPRVRRWWFRCILINSAQLGVIALAGKTWEKWLNSASLFHLREGLSPPAQGTLAYFIATFLFYWWHRARHQSDVLWRLFHQVHHSPQRLEVSTSFYKHPAEMAVNSVIGSLLVYSLLGLSVEGAAVYTFCTAVGEFFYHTNIQTPRWVGYIFQRPEMHRIHHEYGKHRSNYGDIVWWDMLFGTYENPPTWQAACGFDEDKELNLPDMLAWDDVHSS